MTKVDIIKLINKKLNELENSGGLAAKSVMREVKAIINSNSIDGIEFDSDTGEFNFPRAGLNNFLLPIDINCGQRKWLP